MLLLELELAHPELHMTDSPTIVTVIAHRNARLIFSL